MQLALLLFFLVCCDFIAAQESHYHRSHRQQDTSYGLTQAPMFSGSGMYWSRVRNVDDVAIAHETRQDTLRRLSDFRRFCEMAYDAFEAGDAGRTIVYGDSALRQRYHTPDLYFFMATSFEQLEDYKNADWAYRKALESGYAKVTGYYPAFKARMKQRKKELKLKRKQQKQTSK
jgi:hypothetical protein